MPAVIAWAVDASLAIEAAWAASEACPVQNGGHSARKRKRDDEERTATRQHAGTARDPCIGLSILLAGSGIGAGLPGCAVRRAPSTIRSWPSSRIMNDLQARAELKTLWLTSKLRLSHPAEHRDDCAAAVQVLSRVPGWPPPAVLAQSIDANPSVGCPVPVADATRARHLSTRHCGGTAAAGPGSEGPACLSVCLHIVTDGIALVLLTPSVKIALRAPLGRSPAPELPLVPTLACKHGLRLWCRCALQELDHLTPLPRSPRAHLR